MNQKEVVFGLLVKVPRIIVICDFLLFVEFIQTQKRHPTSLEKILILI